MKLRYLAFRYIRLLTGDLSLHWFCFISYHSLCSSSSSSLLLLVLLLLVLLLTLLVFLTATYSKQEIAVVCPKQYSSFVWWPESQRYANRVSNFLKLKCE
jgi:hypothetical protein